MGFMPIFAKSHYADFSIVSRCLTLSMRPSEATTLDDALDLLDILITEVFSNALKPARKHGCGRSKISM
jgi:hypothetical protein